MAQPPDAKARKLNREGQQTTMLSFMAHKPICCLELLATGDVVMHTELPLRASAADAHKLVVKTRGLGDLVLLESLTDDQWCRAHAAHPHASQPQTDNHGRLVAYLKSHVQKAVRRRLTCHAVSAAYTLFRVDAAHLFRRLPLIMVEDSHVTTDIAFLVFCMMAHGTNAWAPTDFHLNRLLTIVKHMAEAREAGLVTAADAAPALGKLCRAGAGTDGMVVAWSCYLRALYGGMQCDTHMLYGLTHQLLASPRASGANGGCSARRPAPDDAHWLRTPLIVNAEAGLVEAVDFHCSPALVSQLAAITGDSEAELREHMWATQSGVNVRRADSHGLVYRHKAEHARLARIYLRNLFQRE